VTACTVGRFLLGLNLLSGSFDIAISPKPDLYIAELFHLRCFDPVPTGYVPAALGMNAKQWMEKYLEGSLSDAFRKLRIFRSLAGVPDEKIQEMPERNAYELCRLPEAERKSPEWVDQATKLPVAQFKDRVDEALEKRGIAREKFGDFYLKAPVDVIEEL